MIFEQPVEFTVATEAHAAKRVLPTSLDTAQLGTEIHKIAFTSARVREGRALQFLKDAITQQLQGKANESETKTRFGQFLRDIGYQAAPGTEGTIRDIWSLARQDLIINTSLETARGYGQAVVQNDPDYLEEWPALELIRGDWRLHPRGDPSYPETSDGSIGWEERWQEAAEDSGDEDAAAAFEIGGGRMVALKSSAIWDSLGSLWDDSLGNNFWPFAFNSGMRTVGVARKDAETLGLLDPGDDVKPAKLGGIADNYKMAADFGDKGVAGLVSKAVKGMAKIVKGELMLE